MSGAPWFATLRRMFQRRERRVYGVPQEAGHQLAWPSAVLFCVRCPDAHRALLLPFEDYPARYPNIFGPPRTEPRCVDCGALMYVSAARVSI